MVRLTPEAPFPPGCAARFRPVKLIASGGFGAVWQAEQVGLERRVAVKLLLDDVLEQGDQVERFLEEARITAAIQHPHVVTLIDHGVDEGVPWIALEYLPGRTLRDLLEAGPLSHELALAAATQVAEALAAAHAKGVLHRDVKPENVIEIEPGRFKVTDFGIAKWRREGAVKTRTGVILGTPAYLAPEVIRGEPVSAVADVYALGVMAYELFSGVRPFTDENPMVLLERHLKTPPPPLAGTTPAVARAVMQALAKQPAERTPSALAFRDALAGQATASPVRSRGGASTRVLKPRSMSEPQSVAAAPRSRALAGGIAVTLCVVGALAVRRAPEKPLPSATAAPVVALEVDRTGPLAVQLDVTESEDDFVVSALTLEPVLLELRMDRDGRAFRDRAPAYLHRWRVQQLQPNRTYSGKVYDPSGRRSPIPAEVQARTRTRGFREVSKSVASTIDKSAGDMLLGSTDLDPSSLSALIERLRASRETVPTKTWSALFLKVGLTRAEEAWPVLLEMSKLAPPDLTVDHQWAAIAKVRDPRAYPALLAELRGAADGVRPYEGTVLANALFNSDPARAIKLIASWSDELPSANDFQIFTLGALARDLHLTDAHDSLRKMVAATRAGWVIEHISRMAVQIGGAGALAVVDAACQRLEALGDGPNLAEVLTGGAEIAGAGDAARYARYLKSEPIVAAAAIRFLAAVGDRSQLAAIRAALSAADVRVRNAAVWALGELKDRESVGALVKMLGQRVQTAGGLVPRALGQIATADAVAGLFAHATAMRSRRLWDGDPATPEEVVDAGDTLRELARLKATGIEQLIRDALPGARPYVVGRVIEGLALRDDPRALPWLRQMSVPSELEPVQKAAIAWLEGKRPEGTPMTLELGASRRTRVSLALGQRFSLFTLGLFVDRDLHLSVLVGADRKIGDKALIVPRVGVEALRDGRTPIETCTRMDAGELVLQLQPGKLVAGFATVLVRPELPGR